MANSPVVQTALSFWGIKRETTAGTYAAPAAAQDFLFVTEGSIEELVEDVFDESYQASFAKQMGYYQGVQSAKVTLKGPVAQAPSGHLFRAALGATSESGAADPFTHNYTLRSAQGPSYTIVCYDATITNVRAVEMARLQSLKLNYSKVQGLLMYEAVFLGKWGDVAQTKPTATFDTANHYMAWQGAVTYGTTNGRLLSLSWNLDNETEVVPGSTGTQAINDVSQNRCTVGLDLTFANVDSTEYNLFRANTQQAFSIVFTQGTHTLTLQTSKVALGNGTKNIIAGGYVTTQAQGHAVNNTTDTGPAKVILINAIATASY